MTSVMCFFIASLFIQEEDRFQMLEQRRKMVEEKAALERAKRVQQKEQQQMILNKTGKARPKLSFSIVK